MVIEVIRNNVLALCVLPTEGGIPYIVRDVPYALEARLYTTSVWRSLDGNAHAVSSWQYMIDTDEDTMPRQTPSENGYSMGDAMVKMFGRATQADNQAVFALARRFATMAGYTDADSAFEYIEGFVNGFGKPPQQITAPPAE